MAIKKDNNNQFVHLQNLRSNVMKRCNTLSQLLLSLIALFALAATTATAQLSLTAPNTPVTIDFTGFTGAGFGSLATQLNSNAWSVDGSAYGATVTGVYADGTTTGFVSTGGIYALNASGDIRLMAQPSGTFWGGGAVGNLTLRAVNNTGLPMQQLDLSYQIYVLNDQARSNSFNLSYSTDGVTFTAVPSANYTTTDVPDAVPAYFLARTVAVSLSGINVPTSGFIYVRWSSADVGGSGSRDEIALDNISLTSVSNTFVNVGAYTYFSNATALSSPTTDLTNIVHASLVDDAISSQINLPFTYYINGKPYNVIVISSNGWVSFGNTASSQVFPAGLNSIPSNDPNSSAFTANPAIAALWDDLRVGINGNVSYSSNASQFKIRWRGMEWPATATNIITFELTLNSAGNQFLMTYGASTNSAQQTATVGLIYNSGNAAPNNYLVFGTGASAGAGANVAVGNTNQNAVANAACKLVTYNNLPIALNAATPTIGANHYDALYVSSPASGTVNFGNISASGGSASQTISLLNLGVNSIAPAYPYSFIVPNAQFSTPATTTIAPGATANLSMTFTGSCLSGRNIVSSSFRVSGVPTSYPNNFASLALVAQQIHPQLAIGTLPSFPSAGTIYGFNNTVSFTLVNNGNDTYNGTPSVSGLGVTDAAQFTFAPSSVSIAPGGNQTVIVTFTPSGASHAANADANTWIALYNLNVVVPQGSQTCDPAPAPIAITAVSKAPRMSISVPSSTIIAGNQSVPTLDLGNKIYSFDPTQTVIPGNSLTTNAFSDNVVITNTGSASVQVNGVAFASGSSRYIATAALIAGNALLNRGDNQTWKITYTPQKTTTDYPYTSGVTYGVAPANLLATASYGVQIASTTPVPANTAGLRGFWHNYAAGATSTFAVSENLANSATIFASINMNRGYMQAVLTQASSSNQAPINSAGAPTLSGGLSIPGATLSYVGDGVTFGTPIQITTYWGAVNDVLPNNGTVVNSGQPGSNSFYIVNNGNANARFYVRASVAVDDANNPGAFSLGTPFSGTGAATANLNDIQYQLRTINGIQYHTFVLEPLYTEIVGNSKAYARFDISFTPKGSNTLNRATFATDRTAKFYIYTDANLPISSASSTEPLNTTPYVVSVIGHTLFNDPIMYADFGLGNQRLPEGVSFGSHELSDATSSNYPFGAFAGAGGVGYNASAEELGRRGLATGSAGPLGFGVRDTVVQITLRNQGNAPMVFTTMSDLQSFANSGVPGTFSVARITTPLLVSASGAGATPPAAPTVPFTLLDFNSATGSISGSQEKSLIMWVRFDAGTRLGGVVGTSSGKVRVVQSPSVSTIPHNTSISYNITGNGIRPFPIVNVNSGNQGSMLVTDGTARNNPVYRASRPVMFDNYCLIPDMGANLDTVRINLTMGNGNPLPTSVGNVNDAAMSSVVFDLNNVKIDSIYTSAGNNIVVANASTSYYVDYSVLAQITNTFGQLVGTQDISNVANRKVTLASNQKVSFTVVFRPTGLVPPASGNFIQARIRVAHSSRNNNIDFPISGGSASQTNTSVPTENGDVYKWMDFAVQGSTYRQAVRAELGGNSASGIYGNYLAPNSIVDFNLPYSYLPGVFLGDSNYVALTFRNSQEKATILGLDNSVGKTGIKQITIEGADYPDFEIVGFGLANNTFEPNPVAFPLSLTNGALATGTSFMQWVVTIAGFGDIGTPYILDRNATGKEAVNMYIHFKPRRTVNGAWKELRNAVIRVVTTDKCNPEMVFNLKGRILDAIVSFDKTTVNFGNVQVNDVSQQNFTMTNTGNYPANFSVSTIQNVGGGNLYSHNFSNLPLGISWFTNNPPNNYYIIGDQTTPLFPQQSRTITMQFSPSDLVRKDAIATVIYAPEVPPTIANGNLAELSVTGRGVPAVSLALNPASGKLDFGNVVAGQTLTLPIVVTNSGLATVTVNVPASVAPFTHDSPATFQLAGGASKTINITFTPGTVGNFSGTYTISSPNAFGTPSYDITCVGKGVSSTAFNFSSLDYSIVRVYTESVKQINVNNAGTNSPAVVVFTGITGPNASEFALRLNGIKVNINTTLWSVPAGTTSANLDVAFTPNQLPNPVTAANIRTATLNFTINGVPFTVTVSGDGAVPQVSFEGSDVVNGVIAFGTVNRTSSSQKQVVVRNIGRFPLNVAQLFVSGGDADQFQLGNVQNVTLPWNQSFTATVTMMPWSTSATALDARIVAISNSLNSRSVELTGARSGTPKPSFVSTLNFAQTRINEFNDKSFTISNNTNNPFTVTDISVSGVNQSDYSIKGISVTLPYTLQAGETITVSVRFNPTLEGDKVASVNFNTSVGAYSVAMLGRAVRPGVSMSSSLNFGNLRVGATKTMSMTISNTGTTDVRVLSIAKTGDNAIMFASDVNSAFTLAANESRTINVTFTALSGGFKWASLVVKTDASANDLTTTLLGNGGAAILSVASSADFGSVNVGDFRSVQLTVNNQGDAPLQINTSMIGGLNSSDFTVTTPMPILIASGSSGLITVQFQPATSGAKVATLTLNNNSDVNAVDVELRGQAGVTGVAGETQEVSFGISSSYPNPAGDFVNISYSIPAESHVTVKIFNQLGILVSTLVDDMQESGNYVKGFETMNLSSGTYMVRLESNAQVSMQKLTIVK